MEPGLKPIIKNIHTVAPDEVPKSRGASIRVLLGPNDAMPNFYTRLFTIEPGGRIPAHRHDSIEHEQVMLEGTMILTLDGQAQEVSKGQAICIPAGVAHSYENRQDTPVLFLCMVPAIADYGTEWLEESEV